MSDILPGAPASATKKQGRGCCFYGCLTAVVLTIILGISMFFIVKKGLNMLLDFALENTTTTPIPLPTLDVTQDEYLQTKKKFEDFKKAVESGVGVESVEFTARELNSLIAQNPDMAELKDKVFLELQGSRIGGKINLPLDLFDPQGRFLEKWGLKGRYFTGEAKFLVSLENGILFVTLDQMIVGGKELPEEILSGSRGKNLAEELHKDPKKMELIRKLQNIKVENGVLKIVRRR